MLPSAGFTFFCRSTAATAAAVVSLCTGAALAADVEPEITFRRDVMPVLSKVGCNVGGCHGNGNGKAGLKLSLRGQDPDLDWQALTRDQGGRRINLLQPEKSLLLLKATATVAHEGGQRITPGSPEHAAILEWLHDGARDTGATAPRLVKITVTPPESVVFEPAAEVQLSATATFADGSTRDITRLAVYEPSNLIIKVSPTGLVTREKSGEATVLVRFLEQQVPVRLAFVPARPDFLWHPVAERNFIDPHVFAKAQQLRVNPSPECADDIFLRRAYLDLTGLVPDAAEARAFLADLAADKRARLVDRLLAGPEFADFWALKWADLLKIEERQLDAKGMRTFHGWIRQSIAENKPLDQFARELVAARGSTYENPPANWYRANRDPVTRAENTARVFLGTQLNCAQCHNHPFEPWTQDDYYDWTSLFARVDYKIVENKQTDENDKNEFKGDQIVLLKGKGSVLNPRTGEDAVPRFLGGTAPQVTKDRDELIQLAEWLSGSPMFARMQVNRVWYNLFGRGLTDPVDDFRASNPPAHPELLEELAADFVSHGYDLRHLIRTIMASATYQLSAEPNDTNADDEVNHTRGILRRLTAEQLLDSMAAVLDVPLEIAGFPAGTRLAQVPEGRKHYRPLKAEVDRFAATFGKPPRLIASDCERSNDTTMPQVFQLISGPLVQKLLTRPGNRLDQLLQSCRTDDELVGELFWMALSRHPSPLEQERAVQHLAYVGERRRAAEDLMWALLNSKEFLFRR